MLSFKTRRILPSKQINSILSLMLWVKLRWLENAVQTTFEQERGLQKCEWLGIRFRNKTTVTAIKRII